MGFDPRGAGRARVLQGSFVGGRPTFSLPGFADPFRAAQLRAFPGSPAAQLRPSPAARLGNACEVPPAVDLAPRGPGQPLPPLVQREMEDLLGGDLSGVRVHVGPQAQRIGARAFTVGSEVHFAPGQYAPQSPHGRRLIAHELTHVLQQKAGRVRSPFPGGLAVVQDQGLEAEAERMGERAAAAYLRGAPARPLPAPSVLLRHLAPEEDHDDEPEEGSCGCGGSCCGGRAPARRVRPAVRPAAQPSFLQPRLLHPASAVQMASVLGKRRNPPRSATPSRLKRLTKRQVDMQFGSGTDAKVKSKKKKVLCPPGTGPGAANWRTTMWDGGTRPGWDPPALALLPALCATPGCGAAAAHRDHRIPYRRYITDNADAQTFCDGTCHFWGISTAGARAASNDLANLQPLCAACNGLKAAADRLDPTNRADPPVLVGPCPTAACPACGEVCL